MRLGFWRAAAGACNIAGVFGFVEIRWGGAQVMIGGEPIDPYFIEVACVGLIAFGALALAALLWPKIAKLPGVEAVVLWIGRILTSKQAQNVAQSKAFSDLATEIRSARDRFVQYRELMSGESSLNPYSVEADIMDMGIKLSTIGLSVPTNVDLSKVRAAVDWWRAYLGLLAPLADMGHLDQAKTIRIQTDGMDLTLGPRDDIVLRTTHSSGDD